MNSEPFRFHLAGINNQNFIMRDEQTGSWWQQVTGEAFQGPLKGRRLNQVVHDELSFAIWKREHPNGRVLRPNEAVAANYESSDWEEKIGKLPVVGPTAHDERMEARALVIGVSINGASKAYPSASLKKQSLLVDRVADVPILLLVGDDGKSVRGYEGRVDGRELEFFARTDTSTLQLIDSETGSEWDFSGKAIRGALAGRQLKKIVALKDYWFDWIAYHPETEIYVQR